MQQADLRQWESKCVQEEAPRCIAACPLHVDAKNFCSLLGQRRTDKAWASIAKTLPLPGILARLCHGPCKDACIRSEAGGAIELDMLERYCADNAKPVAPPRPLPKRGKNVAIIGSMLTGLCAAWEMSRRGFGVTLYTPGLTASLDYLDSGSLPDGVLDRELDSLRTLGVTIKDETALTPALLEECLQANDAVFLDSDAAPDLLAPHGDPDTLTLGTTCEGLFASPLGEKQAIYQAACGRRAANSIERFTQGVSMVTGRELEGPYATRLFTNLDKVETVPPAIDSPQCSEVEAKNEAKRCIQCECMECVSHCEYLRHFKAYPKVYARQIYNNESIVMGTRQANTMINSCMLCGLCETLCPEDFSMADMCLDARRTLVKHKNMPASTHEFALRDMAFANSDKCTLAKHAPGTESSEYVFFPGCQLTASSPDGVEAAYADLRERLGNVGLFLHCCGAPARWSGRQSLTDEVAQALGGAWENLDRPKIIAACPTCAKELKLMLPDAEIISHWTTLRAMGLPDCAQKTDLTLAVNDPCAARHDAMVREDIRVLLGDLGVTMVEPELTGEITQCCGYGGLLAEANPPLAKTVAEKRAGLMEEDYITYCVMCRDMLAKTGKRALHLYDLLYPREDGKADRHSPGYSDRRENRVRLRERLLSELWKEESGLELAPFDAVQVEYTDAAKAIMDERRILHTDVQKVLLDVSTSGKRFVHQETGHLLARFRPVIVTYWVEYEETENGYLVHNAWSHRMYVKGGSK